MGTYASSERAEMDYQVKRLSHHPSIAMWDGCNECGGGGLYESFVMPTVASLDFSRPTWPSCPAPGWTGGVDQLTSRPNGGTLAMSAGGGPPGKCTKCTSPPLGAVEPAVLPDLPGICSRRAAAHRPAPLRCASAAVVLWCARAHVCGAVGGGWVGVGLRPTRFRRRRTAPTRRS